MSTGSLDPVLFLPYSPPLPIYLAEKVVAMHSHSRQLDGIDVLSRLVMALIFLTAVVQHGHLAYVLQPDPQDWPLPAAPDRSGDKTMSFKLMGIHTASQIERLETLDDVPWGNQDIIKTMDYTIRHHPDKHTSAVLSQALDNGSLQILPLDEGVRGIELMEHVTGDRLALQVEPLPALEFARAEQDSTRQITLVFFAAIYEHWRAGGNLADVETRHSIVPHKSLEPGATHDCQRHWQVYEQAMEITCRFQVTIGQIPNPECSYVDTPEWEQALFSIRKKHSPQTICSEIARAAGHPHPKTFRH